MPFTPSSFAALLHGAGFTLWHYRTTDTRAVATAAGYFAAVADRLKPRDIIILQASDALALIPVRAGTTLGPGLTVDGTSGPFSVTRNAAQTLSVSQAAGAIVTTIILAPLAAAIIAGSTIAASAAVTGPVAQVQFTLRDGNNMVVPPARTVAVAAGVASTSFDAPPVGTGYRIRVESLADPAVATVSGTFSVGVDLRLLLQEDDGVLLTEGGSALTQ